MKRFIPTIICLFLTVISASGQTVVTKGRNIKLARDSYMFVDAPDRETRQSILNALYNNTDYVILLAANGSIESPVIITQRKKGLVRDNTLKDCLIGAGTYAVANIVLAVSIDDFFEVNEAGAVVACGLGITSCFFSSKGVIEFFRGKTKIKTVTALTNENQTTKNIINYSGMAKTEERIFEADTLVSEIVNYIRLQLL